MLEMVDLEETPKDAAPRCNDVPVHRSRPKDARSLFLALLADELITQNRALASFLHSCASLRIPWTVQDPLPRRTSRR